MHFDFIYPSTFKNTSVDDGVKKEQDKGTGVEKGATNCVTVPITAMDLTKGFSMLMLMRLDEACIGKEMAPAELGAAITSILAESLTQFGKPTMSSSTDYDVDGHSASNVFASVHDETFEDLHAAASCVISGKNLSCFVFISADCPYLATIAESTVKFGSDAPAPVIPAKLVPACKP